MEAVLRKGDEKLRIGHRHHPLPPIWGKLSMVASVLRVRCQMAMVTLPAYFMTSDSEKEPLLPRSLGVTSNIARRLRDAAGAERTTRQIIQGDTFCF